MKPIQCICHSDLRVPNVKVEYERGVFGFLAVKTPQTEDWLIGY